MLSFAAGVAQGTALPSRQRIPRWVRAVIIFDLGAFASDIWMAARSPADWVNYMLAAWSLVLTGALIGVYRHRNHRYGRRPAR